ncbi:MAG: NAD(P)/FAD-dependent oxidoreductase [Alphaproteobacteria bacterium]|nr:NAD(P)/FAD-dependent oxidoreductase [Alphaproteobacteria bacterium]
MEKQDRQTGGTQALRSTPALIIGAGPVGLFQAFELGLLGVPCEVIDVLPHIGGQCIELYADKPIYDIPGLPRCTGRELIERLQQQIAPFDVSFHLGQQVSQIQQHNETGWLVCTDQSQSWHTQSLFIASGVGAFVPRTLALEGLAGLRGVHFAADSIPPPKTPPHVILAGGDELIIDCLKAWLDRPTASLSLLHRRDKMDLNDADQAWVQGLIEAGRLRWVVGQPIEVSAAQGQLLGLKVSPPEGEAVSLPCDVLVQCLGLSPKLGPIAQWGLDMARRQIKVNTHDFGTSEPGIYAVGDINHYPGKRKLILSGFHEATLAAYGAVERMNESPVTLEYTTASVRLHQRLKV